MPHTDASADLTRSVPAPRPAGMTVKQGHPVPGGSPFPPIGDYGFLSDCEVSALVASSGDIEWMCLPRMDGPSVFAGILDRHRGDSVPPQHMSEQPECLCDAGHDDHRGRIRPDPTGPGQPAADRLPQRRHLARMMLKKSEEALPRLNADGHR